jgi:DNA-binding NtrC family response regulator
MSEKVSALLIYERPVTMAGLQLMLESREIEVQTARSCGDALLRLWGDRPPHLVFTETQLLDGIWADVLSMTRRSRLPINVIVVSRLVDLNLYVQVLERGAFDFIVPPFEVSELDHVIRCAADNILARRAVQQMDGAAAGAASLKESAPQEEICLIDDDLRAAATL